MAIITNVVKAQLEAEGAEVFFVSGAATKWWNAHRSKAKKWEVIALLGGYYWTYKGQEAGPFRTPSAAWRDVYYRGILKIRPPVMDQQELRAMDQEVAAAARKARRRQQLRTGTLTLGSLQRA